MQNIVSFLDYPDAVCGTDDLPHHWRRSVLRVTCARPEGFEGGAWFTAAIRGAWGHRLRERAENDTTVAAALSVFFSTLTHTEPGRSVPVPFTIRCDEIEHVLIAELALQGVADFWRAPAFDAFVRAFEDGLASRPNRRGVRTTFEILDAQWTRGEKLKVPINTGSARLVFRTPLRLGPRHAIRVYWPDMIVGLADRATRMARWQGLQVAPHLRSWRDLAERLDIRPLEMRIIPWDRRSGAQGGKQIAMIGVQATIDIVKPPECLMPLLALGEHLHVGGQTALGLGRYDLLC